MLIWFKQPRDFVCPVIYSYIKLLLFPIGVGRDYISSQVAIIKHSKMYFCNPLFALPKLLEVNRLEIRNLQKADS